MRIFAIDSLPIEQLTDVDRFEQALGGWIADQPYRVRFLAYSRPFAMNRAKDFIRARLRDCREDANAVMPMRRAIDALLREDFTQTHPGEYIVQLTDFQYEILAELCRHRESLLNLLGNPWEAAAEDWEAFDHVLDRYTWKVSWLNETLKFYEELEQRTLRSASYFIVTWEPDSVDADGQATGLAVRTGRPVRVVDSLPPILETDYTIRELQTMLEPQKKGFPYLTVLRSFQISGTFDAGVLHALMDLPFDVSIAIDIETIPKAKAMRDLELSYNGARTALRYNGGTKDVFSERVLADTEYAMQAMQSQGIHQVQVAVLVTGESPRQLRANVETVRNALGNTVRVEAVHGSQAELLKLWSTYGAGRIAAAWKRSTMLSHGVGCLMGLLGYHRANSVNGVMWGIDLIRGAPLFVDLFGDNQAAHAVILGKSGYGKTFFLNMLTIRAASQLGYRVITIDAFRNAERLERALGGGAQVNWIDMGASINVLDIVFDIDFPGGWLPSQVAYALAQLALLMGEPGTDSKGNACYLPRTFTPGERGVLDRALTGIYEAHDPDETLEQMPLLTDLIGELDQQAEIEGVQIADELCRILYGTKQRPQPGVAAKLTSMGRNFNRPTSIDWDFSSDVNCFDFSAIATAAPSLLPFYYAQAVGAINRFMRDRNRDLRRKTLLLIDEFGYAARTEAVARMAADICKVARKYGVGLVVVDQNPETFVGSRGVEQDSPDGRYIYDNAVAKLFFHLDSDPAKLAVSTASVLNEEHAEFLSHAERAQCVFIIRNDVHVSLMQASAGEQRALAGS